MSEAYADEAVFTAVGAVSPFPYEPKPGAAVWLPVDPLVAPQSVEGCETADLPSLETVPEAKPPLLEEQNRNKHTLDVARRFFDQPIEPECAERFRDFMNTYGFEIYRRSRLLSGKHKDKIEPTIVAVRRFMEGENGAEVRRTLDLGQSIAPSTLRQIIANKVREALTPEGVALAFAEFVNSGTSVTAEAGLARLLDSSVGKTVLKGSGLPMRSRRQRPTQARANGQDELSVSRGQSIRFLPLPLVKTSGMDKPEWHERALCAETDPEAFFPEKGESTREAKKICTGCEVRAECLSYALANGERFGVWGGLSEHERRRLQRAAG